MSMGEWGGGGHNPVPWGIFRSSPPPCRSLASTPFPPIFFWEGRWGRPPRPPHTTFRARVGRGGGSAAPNLWCPELKFFPWRKKSNLNLNPSPSPLKCSLPSRALPWFRGVPVLRGRAHLNIPGGLPRSLGTRKLAAPNRSWAPWRTSKSKVDPPLL